MFPGNRVLILMDDLDCKHWGGGSSSIVQSCGQTKPWGRITGRIDISGLFEKWQASMPLILVQSSLLAMVRLEYDRERNSPTFRVPLRCRVIKINGNTGPMTPPGRS